MAYDSQWFKRHLLEGIVPFWEKAVPDAECGGYFVEIAPDGTPNAGADRHLVASSRHVYNFARACRLSGEERHLEIALHGAEFLREKFRDAEHGGFRWVVARDGSPVDEGKYVYGHDFVILACAELAAAGATEWMEMAEETFDLLCDKAWDGPELGYGTSYGLDWTGRAPGRYQNPQMHHVECCLAAWEVTGDRKWMGRAREIARLMCTAMFDEKTGCMGEHFGEGWSPHEKYPEDDILPGHQAEWAWLLLRLHEAEADGLFERSARELLEFTIEHGYDDEHGGVYAAVGRDGRVTRDRKGFWENPEALLALAWAQEHWDDLDLERRFGQTARFCEEHLWDRERGGWWGGASRDGETDRARKGSGWKADYHVVQMCSELHWRLGRHSGR